MKGASKKLKFKLHVCVNDYFDVNQNQTNNFSCHSRLFILVFLHCNTRSINLNTLNNIIVSLHFYEMYACFIGIFESCICILERK